MSTLKKFHEVQTLRELAIFLGYQPKTLSYLLYILPNTSKYLEFTIPKKAGGTRRIKAPNPKIKLLQRRLADKLNFCFEEICMENSKNKSLSHGFRKQHSIITNALKHKNKRHVFNIDLKDFFPSLNFGRVRGFFIKNDHFQLNPKVATIIAQIACDDNELPQGSPCSPIISNLIGHILDIRMMYLAKKTKCTYSRYADDLTFSTNKKEFPEKIAIRKEYSDNKWIPGITLKKEIEKVGFIINENKTSLQYKTKRQTATGLVVNKKVNIKKEYYRQARAMCHNLFENDEFYICKYNLLQGIPKDIENNNIKIFNRDNLRLEESLVNEITKGNINQLEGILSFIYQVKKRHDKRKYGDKLYRPTSISKLYRKLLFYKHFFSLNRPLIICEGKTDIIYLKCALKQLEKEYREFILKVDEGFIFKIAFLHITKNFKDVFNISEGTPGLALLMEMYKDYMKPFKGKGKNCPVIMLIDNDKGSDAIKKKWKELDSKEPFSYFDENLYIAHIPTKKGKYRSIEDLFDDKALNIKVDGKKFKRENIDPKIEYGKFIFAERVVKAHQSSINFDGFKEIFNRFKAIIEDYNRRRSVQNSKSWVGKKCTRYEWHGG